MGFYYQVAGSSLDFGKSGSFYFTPAQNDRFVLVLAE